MPCVVGPYTGVNAILTLLEHSYRTKADATTAKDYILKATSKAGFTTDQIPISSIAVSHGQQDGGAFNLDFQSERYIPFEGAGAISRWRIELPSAAAVRQFDFNTIADVVLHVRYTARMGGVQFRKAACDAVTAFQKIATKIDATEGLFATIDLKADFATDWYRLVVHAANPEQEATLPLVALNDYLPFFTKGRKVTASAVSILVKAENAALDLSKEVSVASAAGKMDFKNGVAVGSFRTAGVQDVSLVVDGSWSVTFSSVALKAKIERVLLVFSYTIN